MKSTRYTLARLLDHPGNKSAVTERLSSQIRISATCILVAAQGLLGLIKAKADNHLPAMGWIGSAPVSNLLSLLPVYQYDAWDSPFYIPSEHSYIGGEAHPLALGYSALPPLMPWPSAHPRYRTVTGTHYHHPTLQDRQPQRMSWEYPQPGPRFKRYRRKHNFTP